jgi:YbbR domain-containing protein
MIPPRSGLMRALTEELPLKVVSLVIAVTLFVIVRSDKDAATGAYVKVIYTLPEGRVLVSDPVAEVRVGVRGPWTRLSRFDERNVEAIRVDLADAKDGVFHFDESMVKLPPGLRVASITPPEVKLVFEPRAMKEIPVHPVLDGQPADGFRVAKVTSQPTSVHLEGPKSVIDALLQVNTRPVKVAGAKQPVLAEVLLENEPPHTRYLESKSAVVHAEIQPAIVERTFDDVAVRVIGLLRLEGVVDPSRVRVILRGPSDLVLHLAREAIDVQIDAQLLDSRPPAKLLRNLTVTGVPQGVAAELSPDTVMLSTHRRRD